MKRRNMKLKKLCLTLILTVMAAAWSTAAMAQTIESERIEKSQSLENQVVAQAPIKKRNDLTGVWLVNVQETGPTAEGKPEIFAERMQMPQMPANLSALTPFTSLNTFHADGIFIENSLADYLPPQGTPGQGLWARIVEGEFNLT